MTENNEILINTILCIFKVYFSNFKMSELYAITKAPQYMHISPSIINIMRQQKKKIKRKVFSIKAGTVSCNREVIDSRPWFYVLFKRQG